MIVQITRVNESDGFVYYIANTNKGELHTFSMNDMAEQLHNIYAIDIKKYMYNFNNN